MSDPTDTSVTVAARYRALLMARSGVERLAMASRMFDDARTMVLASFPGDLSLEERNRRLFGRLYPEAPAAQVPSPLRMVKTES